MGCGCGCRKLGTNRQDVPASFPTTGSTANPRPLSTTEQLASYDPVDDHLGTARSSAQPPRTPSGSETPRSPQRYLLAGQRVGLNRQRVAGVNYCEALHHEQEADCAQQPANKVLGMAPGEEGPDRGVD